jgi:hypothetical protein
MRSSVIAAALASALASLPAKARLCAIGPPPGAPPIVVPNALDYSAGRPSRYRDTTSPYRMSRSRARRALEKRTKRAQRAHR